MADHFVQLIVERKFLRKSNMNKPLYYIPIFMQKVGFVVFYILHKTFVRIKVSGRENLLGLRAQGRPVIFALNHTSELDVTASPLILGFLSPLYPLYYVTAPKDKFDSFGWRNYIYGGIFFNILGGYPIRSGFKDYETSLETFIDLLDDRQTVLIFPEGKRTEDGKVGKARGGLGFLVYETGATVVPVSVNTFHDMAWWKYFGMQRRVKITILPPVLSEELTVTVDPTVEDYQNTSRIILDKIAKVL